jgi:hypothetical protein
MEIAEDGPNTPAQTTKKNNPWHLPFKLLISFIEAMGRSSEDFYVYLPLADEIKEQEASGL